DKVIIVPIINGSNFNPLKEEAIKHPKIISIGGTQEHIGFGNYRRTVKDEENEIEVDRLDIGQGYIETMGLRLLEGRKFDPSREEADRQGSIIVNRKMVRDFGWEEPIGKEVWMYDTVKLTVIGVVDDFYTQGVWQAINPTMLGLAEKERYYNMVVCGLPEDLSKIQAFLKEIWQAIVPNYPYGGRYQEETMAEAKAINKGIKEVQIFLALIATLLSLIGMYTLVSLSIINRTKEVGIRKVFGASIVGIMNNLNRNFMYILLIAAILGCVGGYYMSEMLMGSIWDHYLDINPVIFVYPVIFIFLISFITTGGKVYQAASRNPADSLRFE
ncbi:MAG: ABC transporter permease, partial [Bacteroidales bacterium]|nr:ABC transporter permease [Bacteroidales bacterium]